MYYRKAIGYGISNPIEAAKAFNEFRNNIDNIAKKVFKENDESVTSYDYGITDTGSELIIKDVYNHSGIEIRAKRVGYGSRNRTKYDATLYDNGREIITLTDIEEGLHGGNNAILHAASDIVFWFSVKSDELEDATYTPEQDEYIEKHSDEINEWAHFLARVANGQDKNYDDGYNESAAEKDAKKIAGVYNKIYKESVSSMKINIESKFGKASKIIAEGFAENMKPKKLLPIEERAMRFFHDGSTDPYDDSSDLTDQKTYKVDIHEYTLAHSSNEPELTDRYEQEFDNFDDMAYFLDTEGAAQWSEYPHPKPGAWLSTVDSSIDYRTGDTTDKQFFVKVVESDGTERELNEEEIRMLSSRLKING